MPEVNIDTAMYLVFFGNDNNLTVIINDKDVLSVTYLNNRSQQLQEFPDGCFMDS